MIPLICFLIVLAVIVHGILYRAARRAPLECLHCGALIDRKQTLCPDCKAKQDKPIEGMRQ